MTLFAKYAAKFHATLAGVGDVGTRAAMTSLSARLAAVEALLEVAHPAKALPAQVAAAVEAAAEADAHIGGEHA